MSDDHSGSVWTGKNVRLRAVEAEDWEVFHAWGQDDEMNRRNDAIHFPRTAEATKLHTEEMSAQRPEDDMFRWVIENRDGTMVGTINTHSCDRRNRTFSYGLGVAPGHRRRGYASEAILLVLRYYFQELGYQKVTVYLYSFNQQSTALHERLGFQLEGRRRRMIFTNGQYYDLLDYGMTVEEFRARHVAAALGTGTEGE